MFRKLCFQFCLDFFPMHVVTKHSTQNPVIFQVAATPGWFFLFSFFPILPQLLDLECFSLACAGGDSVPLDFERRHSRLIKRGRRQSDSSASHVALPACSSAASSCCFPPHNWNVHVVNYSWKGAGILPPWQSKEQKLTRVVGTLMSRCSRLQK